MRNCRLGAQAQDDGKEGDLENLVVLGPFFDETIGESNPIV